MSGPGVVLVFAAACSGPCDTTLAELAKLEETATRVLVEHGLAVRPAPSDALRPTGHGASPEPSDRAAEFGVDWVLALDLEPGERTLWVTHFTRGFRGAWAVHQASCARDDKTQAFDCPSLERVVAMGLRPRRAEDVDLTAALRFQSGKVGACVVAEDRVPIEERMFGRVEMDLEALPTGRVRLLAIAPALVARVHLGRCLKDAMEAMDVGAFEGEAIKLRIPIDLN